MKNSNEQLYHVAVYGTLMKGEHNEHWGNGASSRVPCTIRGTIYSLGAFPAFVPNPDGQEVSAELLTVDSTVLSHMDVLEGYPEFYRREKIKAMLQDGSVIDAMVYVMNRLPHYATIIESGSWRKR